MKLLDDELRENIAGDPSKTALLMAMSGSKLTKMMGLAITGIIMGLLISFGMLVMWILVAMGIVVV